MPRTEDWEFYVHPSELQPLPEETEPDVYVDVCSNCGRYHSETTERCKECQF